MLNQRLIIKTWVFVLLVVGVTASQVQAQTIQDIRWKSEDQVRQILGEPQNVSQPTGTHATYTLWKYDKVTVAFANNRAFHLFNNDSLEKIVLEENR